MNRNELIAKHFGPVITQRTRGRLNRLIAEHEANRPLYPELVAERDLLKECIKEMTSGAAKQFQILESENERLIGLLERYYKLSIAEQYFSNGDRSTTDDLLGDSGKSWKQFCINKNIKTDKK